MIYYWDIIIIDKNKTFQILIIRRVRPIYYRVVAHSVAVPRALRVFSLILITLATDIIDSIVQHRRK